MTQQSLDKCGPLALDRLDSEDSIESFLEQIAAADDAAAISTFVSTTADMWGTMRSLTLVACYRMKQLFTAYETRATACEATGYTSWTDWLTSIDWPISVGLIRTRILDMGSMRRAGASWDVIHRILANAPTAGHDMVSTMLDSAGRLLSHINEDDLPGGSVQGLMEAIAESPHPGQGRALVEQVSGRPRIYPERMVISRGRVYLNLVLERPNENMVYYVEMSATDSDGMSAHIPPAVARWLSEKIGIEVEG